MFIVVLGFYLFLCIFFWLLHILLSVTVQLFAWKDLSLKQGWKNLGFYKKKFLLGF